MKPSWKSHAIAVHFPGVMPKDLTESVVVHMVIEGTTTTNHLHALVSGLFKGGRERIPDNKLQGITSLKQSIIFDFIYHVICYFCSTLFNWCRSTICYCVRVFFTLFIPSFQWNKKKLHWFIPLIDWQVALIHTIDWSHGTQIEFIPMLQIAGCSARA